MLLIDIVYVVLLFITLIAWWKTSLAGRRNVLVALSIATFIAIGYGYTIHRWQLVPGLAIVALLWLFFLVRSLRALSDDLPWLSGSILTITALVPAFLIYTFPVRPLPAPTGDAAVGVVEFELVDEGRKGLLGVAADQPRRLLVRAWYPASDVSGTEVRPYFTPAESSTTATGPGSIVGLPFYFTHVGNALTNSHVMAKPAADLGKLPVVIYSHGYTSFAGQNTVFMEALASHGYLVFSVHHTGDGSAAVMPNGDVIPMAPEILESFSEEIDPNEPNPFEALVTGDTFEIRRQGNIDTYYSETKTQTRLRLLSGDIWVTDREFVQEKLAEGDVPEAVQHIVSLGDYTRTGEMGMSFGGTTSASLCMTNKRCAAAINLDGGDYHYNTFNRHLPVPFLMVYSDMDGLASALTDGRKTTGYGFNAFSYERHETMGLRDDVHRVMISDVTHIGISDFNWFVRRPFRDALLGVIDAEDILQIQNDLVLGFFDTYLRNQASDFPTGVVAKHAGLLREYDISEALREDWISRNPEDTNVRVMMETSAGDIELAIYPERAPVSANNFLAYVDGGHYTNTSLYRVTRIGEGASRISVVQGGRAGDAMAGPADEVANSYALLPPISHETTETTGIDNERGTIAYARFDPGTAGSEFFFNVHDNPGLNSGNTNNGRDGHGYATFGRIIRGLKVLEAIQLMPAERATSIELLQGQLLTDPVVIERVYRIDN